MNFSPVIFNMHLDLAIGLKLPNEKVSSTMKICEMINQNGVSAKQAIAKIFEKISSPDLDTALYALSVLESVVKNCGSPIHEEISNKSSCETFANLVCNSKDDNFRNKMLELIQSWSIAFRSSHRYRSIKNLMNILETEGFMFPEVKNVTDNLFTGDVTPCHNCGQVFCVKCSSNKKFGIEKGDRVCDRCFNQLQKSTASTSRSKKNKLPVKYSKFSFAEQSQLPRTTGEEFREEEDLELALALSLSEEKNVGSTLELSQKMSKPTESKLQCPICFEDAADREPQSTLCGHIFCKVCIEESLLRDKKCPFCKMELSTCGGYHNIYPYI